MTVLCELLPASVPCLLLCLRILCEAQLSQTTHVTVSERLGFGRPINLDPMSRLVFS